MATPFDSILNLDPTLLGGSALPGVPQMGVGGIYPGLEQTPFPMPMQTTSTAPIPGAVAPTAQSPAAGLGIDQMTQVPGVGAALPPVQFGQPPQGPAAPGSYDWNAIERAIDNIESGGTSDAPGRYDMIGPRTRNGDRAYGRFQVMGNEVPELTRQYYGRALTPEQFLQNPEAQHAVFRGRFAASVARYGNPTDAAQEWFAGAGSFNDRDRGLGRTDAGPGYRGTSVQNYRRMFESNLSRFSSGNGGRPGFTPQSMEMSPEFAAATGAYSTSVPAPLALSGQASAAAPGLAAAIAATGGPAPSAANSAVGAASGPMQLAQAAQLPSNVARPGWLGVLDQLGLATPGLAGTREAPPTGFTPYGQWFDTLPIQQQQQAAEIIQRGQQLRAENPGMPANQLAGLLVRDPVFGRNATGLGAKANALLAEAVRDPTLQQPLNVNGALVQQDPSTGAFTQQFQGLPDQAQLYQWYLQQPPAVQNQLIDFLARQRQAQQLQSDKEQAIARITADEAAGRAPSQHDLNLAGYLRQEPVLNAQGNPIGYRTVNTYQPGGLRPNTGVGGSPSPNVAPGGGPAASVPGAPPPASGAEAAPQQTFNTNPIAVGRRGNTPIMDVPDLALGPTMLANPAHMALGAGPIPAALGAWGRVLGNIMPQTEEEVQTRQTLLQQARSAYAAYRKGSRLAGEHRESMADFPQPGEIFSNPLRSVNQLIGVREGLVREMQLARQQSQDQGLDTATRREASNRIIDIQNLLMRLPTTESMIQLSDDLRRGANIAGINPSEVVTHAQEAVSAATSGRLPGEAPAAQTALPPDIAGLGDSEIIRLSKRGNLTDADKQRLIQEIDRRRDAATRNTPAPPISR